MIDWNERYATTDLPWDTGHPCPYLVASVEAGELPPGRVLEVGCGTGTNAVWLAQRGFRVVALDLSERAIARARDRAAKAGVNVDFRVADFLGGGIAGPFDAAYDRGVFHQYEAPGPRGEFAAAVAAALGVGGCWLSICGSTEGAPRDTGPPRRTARELVEAVEPHLHILSLLDGVFDVVDQSSPRGWRLLAGRRAEPAQPSSRR